MVKSGQVMEPLDTAFVAMIPKKVKILKEFYNKISSFSFVKNALPYAVPHMANDDVGMMMNSCTDHFPVKGGFIVNLRTGELRGRTEKDYFTREAKYGYNQNAPPGKFTEFISKFCCEDQARIDALQRDLGYCITGSLAEQVMWFMVNEGSNAKSTLIEIICAMLGSMVCKADFGTICGKNSSKPKPEVIDMMDALIVFLVEGNRDDKLNEGLMKVLTGESSKKERDLYSGTAEYKIRCRLWFMSNHAVNYAMDTEGSKRRVRRQEALAYYAKNEEDYQKAQELLKTGNASFLKVYKRVNDLVGTFTEADFEDGIRWLVEGAMKWYASGLANTENLPKPAVHVEPISKTDSDTFSEFVDMFYVPDKGGKVQASEVEKKWRNYLEQRGEKSTKVTQLREYVEKNMKNAGIVRKRDSEKKPYYFHGISAKKTVEDEEEDDTVSMVDEPVGV